MSNSLFFKGLPTPSGSVSVSVSIVLTDIRVFHKYTTLAIMPILASEVLLRENKKSGKQNVTPGGNRTTGLGFKVQHAPSYTNLTCAT